jgi:hypothetical protein
MCFTAVTKDVTTTATKNGRLLERSSLASIAGIGMILVIFWFDGIHNRAIVHPGSSFKGKKPILHPKRIELSWRVVILASLVIRCLCHCVSAVWTMPSESSSAVGYLSWDNVNNNGESVRECLLSPIGLYL